MKSLLIPGIWIAVVAILLRAGVITPNAGLITFALHAALVVGLLIAWRFHSSRIFFALLVVFLAERGISYYSSLSPVSLSHVAGHIALSGAGATALAAVGVLLPLDFVLISLTQEKGFIFSSIGPAGLLLFVESVIVAVLCRVDSVASAGRVHHPVLAQPLPFATLIAFGAAAVVLLIRFLLFRKPVESGLLWALAASGVALRMGGAGRVPSAYFATAAFILAVSMVETSYLLAYHDELTGLPSRRAFHEALLRLEAPYSIAMVDIDHFKRCNDTYGHDTGDQVLRMVAGRLGRVTGGGRAYRCGGEEFAVVFAGKGTKEVLDPLEQLRASIEASSFRLRGQERRQEARGPDRRNLRTRARTQTGHAIRQLAREAAATDLSVTASIGVASASAGSASADEVVKAADKALYRAKAGGRNRIETAASARRRTRGKAAGIA
jgi:diguanylate cyclase (GGDEF)-like protein